MEFRDFYELAAKVAEYEELLREESQWRKAAMGSYCQEVDTQEIVVADLSSSGSCVCPLLIKKTPETWKKTSNSNTSQFSFDVAKTEEIFDFLLKEKFCLCPQITKFLSGRSSMAESIVSITTPSIIQLTIAGVLEMWYMTESTRGS